MRLLELKKNLTKDFSRLKKIRIALLGDSATQFLAQAIRGYGYEVGFDLQIFEAEYDQIERQILYSSSELYQSEPEYVIVFQAAQKMKKKFYGTDMSRRNLFAYDEARRIEGLLAELNKNMQGHKIILTNFMEMNDSVFGQYANKTDMSLLYQMRRLNCELMTLAVETKNLFICDVAALTSAVGQTAAVDNRHHIYADMAFSLDFLPSMAKAFIDIVQAVSGASKKCLILDLDNTIWGGVIGDDGIEKLQIGNVEEGKVFTELQSWARELERRGILLAICSKNDEGIAKTPFKKHPDMVLTLDNIAIFVANWESKVDNIKKIKSFLNISYDSIVFIDDNPYERGVVRFHLPEITVPDLPEDPVDYLPFLYRLNLFETTAYTQDDTKRTAYFQQEQKREITQCSFTDEGEFLKSLGMTCEINPFSTFNIPRAAQLVQRSNQFNLRTTRYTEEDLQYLATSESHLSWTFSIHDLYGAYGLISVVIGRLNDEELFIDTWVMSCRVLKKGVEKLALNEIIHDAACRGVRQIRGEYIPTAKNGLVKDHYLNLGFSDAGNGQWTLDVAAYKPHEHFIALNKLKTPQ
jgi:FkbH-like protein